MIDNLRRPLIRQQQIYTFEVSIFDTRVSNELYIIWSELYMGITLVGFTINTTEVGNFETIGFEYTTITFGIKINFMGVFKI
jgi:hypothetical protein